jgi:hypothetical protein
VGFSRREVPHLGNLSAVGINCAACHVGEVRERTGAPPVRVYGVASHFDAEAFFGSLIAATFRTADPASMKKYLAAMLAGGNSTDNDKARNSFDEAWQRQEEQIVAAMKADPAGSKGLAPGALHEIDGADLRFDARRLDDATGLVSLASAHLRLFHNMRAALHVPDQPPDKAPPASGPGRNDAFGLLSATLLGAPQPFAPVKFGLVWNLENRTWVHWDGNTRSPIGRNVLASLGLGAPLVGKHAQLDFAAIKRHTALTEIIRPPRYPFKFDEAAARRGAAHYKAHCASCHDGPEDDTRLHDLASIGTDPLRSRLFTKIQADRFNTFLAGIESPGYEPPREPGLRSTGKIWSPSLGGAWARSPFLHNGSVRTMRELLDPPAARPKSFRRGSAIYDTTAIGFADEGAYIFDTTIAGNSNAGHDYGTQLSTDEKRELIEFLKTL